MPLTDSDTQLEIVCGVSFSWRLQFRQIRWTNQNRIPRQSTVESEHTNNCGCVKKKKKEKK